MGKGEPSTLLVAYKFVQLLWEPIARFLKKQKQNSHMT